MNNILFFLQSNYKKLLGITFVLFVVGVFYYFVSNFGFYEVTVEYEGSGSLSVELIDQSNRESTVSSSTEKVIKKFVRKNNYEAIVSKGSSNGYASFKSGGFLRTTKVTIPIQKEKKPEFVGSNPSPCMYFLGGILYSYECRATSTVAINKHVGATGQTPGYVVKSGEIHLGNINTTIETPTGTLAVVAPSIGTDLYTGRYNVYRVGKNLSLSEGAEVKNGPAISNSVRFFAYKDGVLLAEGARTWYYQHLGENKELKIDGPTNSELTVASLTVENNTPVYTYNDVGVVVSDEQEFSPEKTEFVVFSGNESKHYSLNKGYTHAVVCAENLLCAWNDKLDVYEIKDSELTYARTLTGNISTAGVSGDKVVAVTDTGVLEVDPKTGVGFYAYTLGSYRLCGLEHQNTYSLLCLIDGKSNKQALALDWSQEAGSGQEDKRIYELSKTPEIKELSIYKTSVYIVPDRGNLARQEDGLFGYNATTTAIVGEKIKQAVTRSGLESSGYKVIVVGL